MRSDMLDYLFTLAMASVLIAWVGYAIPYHETVNVSGDVTSVALTFDFWHTATSHAIFLSAFVFTITIYVYVRRRLLAVNNKVSADAKV